LNDQRLLTYKRESAGDSSATLLMLRLFEDARILLNDLQERYPAVGHDGRRAVLIVKLRRQALGWLIAFILGALSGVVGNFLFARMQYAASPSNGPAANAPQPS
jgi:hypothetical protein